MLIIALFLRGGILVFNYTDFFYVNKADSIIRNYGNNSAIGRWSEATPAPDRRERRSRREPVCDGMGITILKTGERCSPFGRCGKIIKIMEQGYPVLSKIPCTQRQRVNEIIRYYLKYHVCKQGARG